MKRYIIAGNWKMNMNAKEALNFFDFINNITDIVHYDDVVKIVCPSFPLISLAQHWNRRIEINFGAQNVSERSNGAYTGEVSADILASIDVEYCIIGHSERRQYYGETDELIRQKWIQLREHKIHPIICVGETLQQRESGVTFDVIKQQISTIFADMTLKPKEDLLVAYEPVWAIGTGKTATPEIAQEVHQFIRNLLHDLYGAKAKKIPLLYGGSVKSSNLKDLLLQKDIDGALVGGASMNPEEYMKMLDIAGELL